MVRVNSSDYYVHGKYDLTHSVCDEMIWHWGALYYGIVFHITHKTIHSVHGLEDITYEICKVINTLYSNL